MKHQKGFKLIKNNDKDIKRDIQEYFEDPNIFLKRNNQIGIGRSSLKQRDIYINNINNITSRKNSVNNIKSLKGINGNIDTGINLSTINNLSLIQKSINSKEEIPANNNIPLNTISLTKEINNEQMGQKNLNDSKKEINNIITKNHNCYINNENNKQNFVKNNKKNIYCITETNHNGKSNNKRLSNNLDINKNINLLSKKNKKHIINGRKKNNNRKKIKIASPIKDLKRPLSVNIHFQYKSSNEIMQSYILGKNREKESKLKGTNNFIPNEVEEETKRKYLTQEKYLKENVIHCYKDKIISKYLAKKCHRKENNLLYNNIENFRIKKQLLDYLENKKNLSEKLGEKYWFIILRRPDFLKNARGVFLNIGKEENNIWQPIVEFPMTNIEIIKKAETPHKENITNFEQFLKNKNLYPNDLFNKRNKDKVKMPNLTEMNNMVIKGRNMVLFEKENFLNSDDNLTLYKRHKYRVFKDPRETNLKYSNDCLYKLDYKYESLPYRTKIDKINTKNKTPKHGFNKVQFIDNIQTEKKKNYNKMYNY